MSLREGNEQAKVSKATFSKSILQLYDIQYNCESANTDGKQPRYLMFYKDYSLQPELCLKLFHQLMGYAKET